MTVMQKLFVILIFILALPLFILISFLVLMCMGRPVLFRQQRTGKHGAIFNILKFRTMRNGNEHDGNRLTIIGKFLRKLSLDELPQLINILKGDMNFVGPRPLLPEYLPLYSKEQSRRHEVKPGISGWAQINGRNAILWEEKFELDVWYVDNHTLFLDCKILLLTAGKVFLRSGINASGEATMPPFTGND